MSTLLEPEDVSALSQFIDCVQLTHPEVIVEMFDPDIIQQLGHRLYDEVTRLKNEGELG